MTVTVTNPPLGLLVFVDAEELEAAEARIDEEDTGAFENAAGWVGAETPGGAVAERRLSEVGNGNAAGSTKNAEATRFWTAKDMIGAPVTFSLMNLPAFARGLATMLMSMQEV